MKSWLTPFSCLTCGLAIGFGCGSSNDGDDDDDVSASASSSSSGSAAETPDASVAPKRVFVTATKYAGDFDYGHSRDLCTGAAQSAQLGGTWKAWVSIGSPNQGDAYDAMANVGPWYLVDGTTMIFASKGALVTEPLAAIDQDEHGAKVDAKELAWTGTKVGGVASDSDCGAWDSAFDSAVGTVGAPASVGTAAFPTGSWTQWEGDNHDINFGKCTQKYRLICFEQ
jgi:hypothetical protein